MKVGIQSLCVVVVPIGCFGLPTAAKASFSVSGIGTATASPGGTQLKYTLGFNPNDFSTPGSAQLTNGNYVTLYDLSPALVPGTVVSVPASLTATIQPTGYTAPAFPGTLPADSPSVDNVTFTYTGGTLLTAASFDVTVTLPGSYTLGSQFGSYAGLGTYQTTSTIGSTGSYFTPVSVPEPASAAACALAGLAATRRRRRD